MRHVKVVRERRSAELETHVEELILQLQSDGNEIVNVSIGGVGNESTHDLVAVILYEGKS